MNKVDYIVRAIWDRIEDRDLVTNSEIRYATRSEAGALAGSPQEEEELYNAAINKLEVMFNDVF